MSHDAFDSPLNVTNLAARFDIVISKPNGKPRDIPRVHAKRVQEWVNKTHILLIYFSKHSSQAPTR